MQWGGQLEGAPGLGFYLLNANRTSSRLWVYSWALLVFSRENLLSVGMVLENMNDIAESIREQPEDWLQEHNKPVLISWIRLDHPATPYCRARDWHTAWMNILEDSFRYPTIFTDSNQEQVFLQAPVANKLELEAGDVFFSQPYQD